VGTTFPRARLRIGKVIPGLPEELPSGDSPTNRSQFYLWSWLPSASSSAPVKSGAEIGRSELGGIRDSTAAK
jgi:hypothetical protein